MINKALHCNTAEELVALAKTENIEISREEAESYLAELDNVELDSKTLEKVAGGKSYKCPGEVCTEHCHLNQWYE